MRRLILALLLTVSTIAFAGLEIKQPPSTAATTLGGLTASQFVRSDVDDEVAGTLTHFDGVGASPSSIWKSQSADTLTIFQVDGGAASIISSNAAGITFGSNPLATTGTLAAGNTTITGTVAATGVLKLNTDYYRAWGDNDATGIWGLKEFLIYTENAGASASVLVAAFAEGATTLSPVSTFAAGGYIGNVSVVAVDAWSYYNGPMYIMGNATAGADTLLTIGTYPGETLASGDKITSWSNNGGELAYLDFDGALFLAGDLTIQNDLGDVGSSQQLFFREGAVAKGSLWQDTDVLMWDESGAKTPDLSITTMEIKLNADAVQFPGSQLVFDNGDDGSEEWNSAGSYAELYEDNDAGTALTISGYTQWVSTTVGEEAGASYADADSTSDNITIGADGVGKYLVSFTASVEGSANSVVTAAVFLDTGGGATEQVNVKGRTEFSAVDRAKDVTGCGILALDSGDVLDLRFDTTLGNIEILSANLNVIRMGH